MGLRVAVVGATGAVGRAMTRILEERSFPVDELIPLASPRSEGVQIEFAGERVPVRVLSHEVLAGADLALVSAGASVSREYLREASAAGVTCIDNSSAFRMEPDVPLSIPEINPEALDGSPKLVAVPNCTAITAMMPIGPLHRAAGLRSLVLSSYQSVSGAGQKGVRELVEQVDKLHGSEDDLVAPDLDAMPVGETFGKTIAFNVVAKVGDFDPESGYSGEEQKMISEPRKILGLPDLEVAATSVRVPVAVGHGVSIMATFSRAISPDEAREVRIRQVPGREDALLLFSCADNLRKGAALNAIQIAEHLFA